MPRVGVVIAAFRHVHMTRQLVGDCLRESALVDVIVVDNGGDYEPVGPEEVIRPGANLGWLRGTNLGVDHLLRANFDGVVVSLNNDTVLSSNFFGGLRQAVLDNQDSLVAPCYNDIYESQRAYYIGPAAAFIPQDREVVAPVVDGTCYAATARLHRRIGPLDTVFGKRGWGGIDDFIIRVQDQGGRCLVTRRAYLEHRRGTTAHSLDTPYERYAIAEMRRGMARKYGPLWRERFGDTETGPDNLRIRLSDTKRVLEDRFGWGQARVRKP